MIFSVDDVEYYKRCRDIRGRLEEILDLDCPHLWFDRKQDVWVAIGENPCPDCERHSKCAEMDDKWSGENRNLLVVRTEDLL